MGAVRDVQSSRGAVDGQIVPAAFAAHLNVAQDVIARRRCENQRDRRGSAEDRQDQSSHVRPPRKGGLALYREKHERTIKRLPVCERYSYRKALSGLTRVARSAGR